MRYFVLSFLLIFSFQSTRAQSAQPGNALLWEVSGNGLDHPSYLYGTFHILCKDDINFSDHLKQTLSQIDTIYMELKLDDPMVMMSGMQYMMMKDGHNLKEYYTDDEYDRLASFFKDSLKTGLEMLQQMKPYLLTSMFYPYLSGCRSPSGVETEILKLAKEDKKPIKGLETMKFQASLFDSIPYELQAKELLKTVDDLQHARDQLQSLIDYYKSQNLTAIDSLMSQQDTTGLQLGDAFLADRNENWVAQLSQSFKNGSFLVAVGAAHLPGKRGLISLLQKAGFEVHPVTD